MKDKLDETGVALKVIHELANERWDVCLTLSEKGFQQISFVNSIATTKVSTLILCFQVGCRTVFIKNKIKQQRIPLHPAFVKSKLTYENKSVFSMKYLSYSLFKRPLRNKFT